MADYRLNLLRREWQSSGRVEDEAAYLSEALRSGELERWRLELAARCAHPAALLVLDLEEEDQVDFKVWLDAFRGAAHGVRVCVALSALRSPPVRLAGRQRIGKGPRAVVRATDRWLACPCVDCARRVSAAGALVAPVDEYAYTPGPPSADLGLASSLVDLVASGLRHRISLWGCIRPFLQGCQRQILATQTSPSHAQPKLAVRLRREAEARLRASMHRCLIKWALVLAR